MNHISDNNWYAMSDERILKQIGAFVKYYRMEQNKTQAIFAKEAGISRSTLSLLERGETVTVATLIRVLRVLGQLRIIDGFIIPSQRSPLILAKEEKRRKIRASSPKKMDMDVDEDMDW